MYTLIASGTIIQSESGSSAKGVYSEKEISERGAQRDSYKRGRGLGSARDPISTQEAGSLVQYIPRVRAEVFVI